MYVRVNTEEDSMAAWSGASRHETRHFASWTRYTLHRIPSNAIEASGGSSVSQLARWCECQARGSMTARNEHLGDCPRMDLTPACDCVVVTTGSSASETCIGCPNMLTVLIELLNET